MAYTRRSALTATLGVAGTLVPLAGCLDSGSDPDERADGADGDANDGGGDGDDNDDSGDDLSDGGYAQWLPASGSYEFRAVRASHVASLSDGLANAVPFELQAATRLPQFDAYRDAATVVDVGDLATVVEGSFDRSSLASELEALGLEREEDRGEVTTFSDGDGRAAALTRDAVVLGGPDASAFDDPLTPVERILDAATDDRERCPAATDGCDALLSALGEADVLVGDVRGDVAGLPDAEAVGVAADVDTDTTALRAAAVTDADGEAVADWARSLPPFPDDVSTREEDRTVVVTADVPTTSIFRGPESYLEPSSLSVRDASPPTPTVNFGFEYEPVDAGAGYLTITHDGGDSLDTERVSVESDGFVALESDDRRTGTWLDSSGEPTEVLQTGDEIVVGVERPCRVDVRWSDDDATDVLDSAELPLL